MLQKNCKNIAEKVQNIHTAMETFFLIVFRMKDYLHIISSRLYHQSGKSNNILYCKYGVFFGLSHSQKGENPLKIGN